MATGLSTTEINLLKFIATRGEKGITQLDLKLQYKEDNKTIVLILIKLRKLGLISEEFARINVDNGKTVVTKLITAKVKQ